MLERVPASKTRLWDFVLVSQISVRFWQNVRCQVTTISYWIGKRFSFSDEAKNKARKSVNLFIRIISSSHKTLHNLSLHWLKSLSQSLIFFVFSFLASSYSHLVPENINQKESKFLRKFDKTYLNICVVLALSVGWLAGWHWAWWRDSSQENVLSFNDVTILQRQSFFWSSKWI